MREGAQVLGAIGIYRDLMLHSVNHEIVKALT